MLYFMAKEKIENKDDIKNFNLDGYSFDKKNSTDKNYIFIKNNE